MMSYDLPFVVEVHTLVENPPHFGSKYNKNVYRSRFRTLEDAEAYIKDRYKSYPSVIAKNDHYERKAYLNFINLFEMIDQFGYEDQFELLGINPDPQEEEPEEI